MLQKLMMSETTFRVLSDGELEMVGGGDAPRREDDIYGVGSQFQQTQEEWLQAWGIWNNEDGAGSGQNESGLCPVNHTCVTVEGSNGMYVRDTADNKLYFSPEGLERFNNPTLSQVDYWQLVGDLLFIAGGSLAGVGTGVVAIVGGLMAVAGETMGDLTRN